MAREQYKRMRALMVMIKAYRLKKTREYINTLQRKFSRAGSMRDYGKSIIWPAPPLSMRDTTKTLRHIYNRWRAQKILDRIPPNERPQMKLKITAASHLVNKRPEYGVNRKWEGDYLATHDENHNYTIYNESVNNMRNAGRFEAVLFSSFVTKFNKFNKVAERVMLVTDRAVFKLDGEKFRNMKEGVAIGDLTGLSVSPGHDQLVVLHCPGGNDLVVSLRGERREDRVGECVGVICHRYSQ